MNENTKDTKDNEMPILSLIQDIKDKRRSPKLLSEEQFEHCIEALLLECLTSSEIAEILECSQKTIQRAIKKIRERNAPNSDPSTIARLIGGMLLKSEMSQTQLMRLVRKKEGSSMAKTHSAYLIWRIEMEKIRLLQSIGVLPCATTNASSKEDEAIDLEEFKERMALTQSLADQCDNLSPEIKKRLERLKDSIFLFQLEEERKLLEGKMTEEKPDENTPNQ